MPKIEESFLAFASSTGRQVLRHSTFEGRRYKGEFTKDRRYIEEHLGHIELEVLEIESSPLVALVDNYISGKEVEL